MSKRVRGERGGEDKNDEKKKLKEDPEFVVLESFEGE